MQITKEQSAKLQSKIVENSEVLDSSDFGLNASQIDLMKKVAAEATPDDFYNFINSGQMPAISLSPKEMEQIRGGGWVQVFVKVCKEIIATLIT